MTNAKSPTLLRHSLEQTLLAECAELKTFMHYDEAEGFYFWPNVDGLAISEHANQCGICTTGARIIAKRFGGFVAGYLIDPGEPRTLIGADVFGHDFAVVGDFIVDWWGWEYEGSLELPVILRAEGIALGKYKPEEAWQIFPDHDFRGQFWRGSE
jgi:hypothetical protein